LLTSHNLPSNFESNMVLDKSSPKSIFWGLFDLLQEDLSSVLSKGFNESRRLKDSSVWTWPNSATESNNLVAIASESTEVLFSRPFKKLVNRQR
jgi:hypothetical protein